jgi:hypothetical protein
MSIGNKYGWGQGSSSGSCCGKTVQPAPSPCCESHETVLKASACFYSTADIIATTGVFFLTFSNDQELQIPLNIRDVFFYHAAAGKLRIVSKNNGAYGVSLVDESKAGVGISSKDCILVYVDVDSENVNTFGRCLIGSFAVPLVNGNQTIYIENGGNISLGSTITFVYEGVVGSYSVTDFVSASGSTYVYTVQNTGSGHAPGTVIDGGQPGSCAVPIELITEVDFCGLPEANVADHLVSCVSGAPRGLVPTGEGDTLIGKADKTWGIAKITNLDCCVILAGCLKFTSQTCPGNSDSVELVNTNLECFAAAISEALAQEQVLAMNINGFNLVCTAYDSGTRIATFEVADDMNLTSPLTFEEGSQVCLGPCCDSCLIGPGSTEVKDPISGITSPLQSVSGSMSVPIGVSYWLFGLNNTTPQTVQILQLTAPWFAAPGPNGPILPKFSDPFVFRQKVCNNSEKGCHQFMMLQLNYQIAFDPMPPNMTVDWELAHYAANADILANGLPNPYTNIATQQKANGRLQGPSVQDATLLNTSLGAGSPGDIKVFPFGTGDFRDLFSLIKCDCALSAVWCFARIDAPAAQTLNILLRMRRHLQFFDDRRVGMPLNQPQANGWR